MRELRFLVPPTMAYLTWILATNLYGQSVVFGLGSSSQFQVVGIFISLPAIGFLISQITVFAINMSDLVFNAISYKKGTFYYMDVESKDSIARKVFTFDKERRGCEVNTRLWFTENMKLDNNELSKWIGRRWSVIMTNLSTIVALVFTWDFFTVYYNINFFSGFFPSVLGFILFILLFNLLIAWKEVRLVETYFFENLPKE